MLKILKFMVTWRNIIGYLSPPCGEYMKCTEFFTNKNVPDALNDSSNS